MVKIHIPGLGRLVAMPNRVSAFNHRGVNFWSISDQTPSHLPEEMLRSLTPHPGHDNY